LRDQTRSTRAGDRLYFTIELQFQRKPLVLSCDAPDISSDGGVLLLRQLDDRSA